jgi:heat shock protein HslJ
MLRLGMAFIMISSPWSICMAQDCSTDRFENREAVVGTTWQWVGTVTPVEQIEVPEPERYTFRLMEDGTLQAQFDCNRGGGSYEIENGHISFGPMTSTRMACPEDSLDQLFMRDLQRAVIFFMQDGMLYLDLPYDSGTMRFRHVP